MTCMLCSVALRKSTVNYKGVKLVAWQCPECKQKIFTEDLAVHALQKLEQSRLAKEYVKKPMKIGHSWGMTFPKALFQLCSLSIQRVRVTSFSVILAMVANSALASASQ